MKRIAIILARGGSKRLPRKNLLDFHGKPLLAWSVEAAYTAVSTNGFWFRLMMKR